MASDIRIRTYCGRFSLLRGKSGLTTRRSYETKKKKAIEKWVAEVSLRSVCECMSRRKV
jgi:hypothetical protein